MVSKVLFEVLRGIFNERFLKIKNVDKIKKTLKNVKNVTGIKNVKNVFYIYGHDNVNSDTITVIASALSLHVQKSRDRATKFQD